MAENPYERRRRRAVAADTGWAVGEMPNTLPAFSLLTVADLDVMTRNVAERCVRERMGRLERDRIEALQDARRQAWDEGHDRGVTDGWRALRSHLGVEFGDRVRSLTEAGGELLEEHDRDPVEVARRLREAVLLLEAMAEQWREFFPRQG